MANSLYLRNHPKLKSAISSVTTTNQLYKFIQEALLYQRNLQFHPIRNEEPHKDTEVEDFAIDIERIDRIYYVDLSRTSPSASSSPDKKILFSGRTSLPFHDRFMYFKITAHCDYNINKTNRLGTHNRHGTVYYSRCSDSFGQYLENNDYHFNLLRAEVKYEIMKIMAEDRIVKINPDRTMDNPTNPKEYDWELIEP